MRALLLAVLALAIPAIVSAQSYLPVATWVNDAAHQPASARLTRLLEAQHITPVVTCSAGCTLSVQSQHVSAARTIIGQAMASEHLDVSLVPIVPTS